MNSIFGSIGSIFGPAKAPFGSLPTPSPNSDREISSPNIPTSGIATVCTRPHPTLISTETANILQDTTNVASSSSTKGATPDDEISSDDDCIITAIRGGRQPNPVQLIPKREETEGEGPFGGRFKSRLAARATCLPMGKDDNGIPKPTPKALDKEEFNGNEGAANLSGSQKIKSTNHGGTPVAGQSRENPSTFGPGSSKRPLVIDDDEALSQSGSVGSAKRRRLSFRQQKFEIHAHRFSKNHRLSQRIKRESGPYHSRILGRWKDPRCNSSSLATFGSNLDEAKSKEITKSIRNTPTTAGVKATEKVQQIKERAKEVQTPKPAEEQAVQEFLSVPIETILATQPESNTTDANIASNNQQITTTEGVFGDKTASARKITENIVSSNSQRNKSTRVTQDDKNQASNQPEPTPRKAPAKQPSHSTEEPSQPAAGESDADLFNRIKSTRQTEMRTARIVNKLPIREERAGYRFTSQRATNDSQQPPKEDGRPTRAAPPRKRNKPTQTTSSKPPPTLRANNTADQAIQPPVPPSPCLPAPAPDPVPVASSPPPAPPKKAVPAESIIPPTAIILQYVIYHTQKRDPISEPARNRRDNVYISKKEANETCLQRFRNLIKADTAFETVERHYDRNGLFIGRITYEDGDVQDYYVREEEVQLGDVVQERKLFLDEEGMGIYMKRLWAVWSVRYYPSGDEEK